MNSYINKAFRILLLFISIGIDGYRPARACGPFYAMGEEVRISLMTGDDFATYPLHNFTYSASSFVDSHESWGNATSAMLEANINAWLELTEFCVTEDDVYNGLYVLTTQQLFADTTSSLNRYLRENNRKDLKDYLLFLEKITHFKSRDPWEQYNKTSNPALDSILHAGIHNARVCADNRLRTRYVYVTLRCAMMDNRQDWCEAIYLEFYAKGIDQHDPVAWWSKAIYADCMEKGNAKMVALAELFVHCPERQFWAWLELPNKVDWQAALQTARTNELKRCVCVLAAIDQPYRSAKYLEKLAQLNPDDPLLNFLVFREINKLEDWVYSGVYFNMEKSTFYNYWYGDDQRNNLLASAQKEQNYARQCAQMLWAKGYGKGKKDELKKWQLAYLSFIAGDHKEAYEKMSHIQTANFSKEQQLIYQRILMLCMAKLDMLDIKSASLQHVLLFEDAQKLGHNKWLFVLGQAFQRHHHPVEALLVMAAMQDVADWERTAVWRAPHGEQLHYFDYYWDLEGYLPVGYSTEELLAVMAAMETLERDYPLCLAERLKKIEGHIELALGTIYLREDNLELAEAHYVKASEVDWNIYKSEMMLDHNPFYTNFYRCHDNHISDTTHWSKAAFVRRLRLHIHCMNQPDEPYRAYHAFQAAVAYFNMTRHGDAWQMRRANWKNYEFKNSISDDEEYNNCIKAKQLFQRAAELAESEEFKALSLMMAARCATLQSEKYLDPMYNKSLLTSAKFHPDYAKVYATYPEHYERFMATCHSYDEYFQCYALNGAE